MDTKTKSKEVLNDLMEGTKKLITRLRDDVDELSTKGKLRMELMSLKNKRSGVFKELGIRTYILIKNGKYSMPEVKTYFEEIKKLDEKISEHNKSLKKFVSGKEEASGKSKEKKPAVKTKTKTVSLEKPAPKKKAEKPKASGSK